MYQSLKINLVAARCGCRGGGGGDDDDEDRQNGMNAANVGEKSFSIGWILFGIGGCPPCRPPRLGG
jgi:hypothetical protein